MPPNANINKLEFILGLLHTIGTCGCSSVCLEPLLEQLIAIVQLTNTFLLGAYVNEFLRRVLLYEALSETTPVGMRNNAIDALLKIVADYPETHRQDMSDAIINAVIKIGPVVGCNLCNFRRTTGSKVMCPMCSNLDGVHPELTSSVESPLLIKNAIKLLECLMRCPLHESWKVYAWRAHDAYWHAKHLPLIKVLVRNDGDRTALNVCLGVRFCYRFNKKQPSKKAFKRWNLNWCVMKNVMTFLVESNTWNSMLTSMSLLRIQSNMRNLVV